MSGIEKFSCEQARELLDDFHDNELSVDKRASVDTHLTGCEPCRVALADIESVSTLLKTLPKERLGKDFSEDIDSLLVDKVVSESKDTNDTSNVVPLQRKFAFASAAAAILLLAFAIHGTINHETNTSQPQVAKTVEDKAPDKNAIENNVEQPVVAKKSSDNSSEPVKEKSIEEDQNATKVAAASDSNSISNSTPDMISKKEAIAVAPPRVVPKKEIAVAPPAHIQQEAVQIEQDQLLSTEAVVAFDNDEQDNLFYQMGIGTDEDGLYAIKL